MADKYIPKITFGSGPTTITFEFPPKKDPVGEQFKHVGNIVIAKSGLRQTLTDHIEIVNKFEFTHLTAALKASLDNFFQTHALLGKSFSYFFDKDDATTEEIVTLDKASSRIQWEIMTKNGTDFVYKLKGFAIRRVL